MSRYLIIGLALGIIGTSPASGANWHHVAENSDNIFYVDLETAQHDGEVWTYWVKQDEKSREPGENYRSIVAHNQIDCSVRTKKTLHMIAYGYGGEVVSLIGDRIAQPIAPGTMLEETWTFLCKSKQR